MCSNIELGLIVVLKVTQHLNSMCLSAIHLVKNGLNARKLL